MPFPIPKVIFFYYGKSCNGKKYLFSNVFFFQFGRIFFWHLHTLQLCSKHCRKEFKFFQMSKIFFICKRICFAISDFAIIKEVPSYLKNGWLYVLLLFLLWNAKKLNTILLSSNPIQDTKLCLIRKLYNSCQSKSFQILCKFCKYNI